MRAAPPPADGSVQLIAVSKRFGSATAVERMDLEVESGEFLSLLGPSGCGKTTLLRMIAGFEHPDSGDILVGGSSVLDVQPHKRPVNTVFQSYALFPHMTVAENVAYGLRQRRVPKAEIAQRVADALDTARMRQFADRSPQKLSGGQQQRVALARALVNRPRVLLLDEPMSALDRKLREEMQIELKLLQRQLGTTFVFVTHDQQEAMSMSDRIAVMDAGVVQQLGTTQEVYAEPANAFVAGFLGKQNFVEAVVQDDGRLLAEDGVLPGRQRGARTGDRVVAAVRAESITVTTASASDEGLPATVAGISFLGDVMQYVLVTPSGLELLARVEPGRGERLAPGDRVRCGWEPAALRVFPPEPGAAPVTAPVAEAVR